MAADDTKTCGEAVVYRSRGGISSVLNLFWIPVKHDGSLLDELSNLFIVVIWSEDK